MQIHELTLLFEKKGLTIGGIVFKDAEIDCEDGGAIDDLVDPTLGRQCPA